MEYRHLGRSGLQVSALSFGAWVTFHFQMDETASATCMKKAYDAGVNFFDNAEAYADGAAEVLMGKVFRRMEWPRDTYCVSSKVFWGGRKPNQKGLSRKHVFEACHAALQRLQVDYLDLYFCHRPDPHTPIEETVRAMHDLVSQGKVLYWGTSEWSAQQVTEAYSAARQHNLTPPTMEQPQYNMFCRERVELDLLPLYSRIGLGITAWSPLCSGILSGKYAQGIPEKSRASLPEYDWLRQSLFESSEGKRKIQKTIELAKVARQLGVSPAKMSIAWCLKNPHVSTVILGASRLGQLEENLEALDTLPRLSPDVLEKIENILDNRPLPPRAF